MLRLKSMRSFVHKMMTVIAHYIGSNVLKARVDESALF